MLYHIQLGRGEEANRSSVDIDVDTAIDADTDSIDTDSVT
ncbi:hypothetical protein EDD98_7398 [Streptomyces sp. PanSC19]|nr:hypothetical protein EDD98_7398 [Streptomyces sp. PanSC19]